MIYIEKRLYWRTFMNVYNSPKQLLKLIVERDIETNKVGRWANSLEKEIDLLKVEKERWKKAFWDIMFKKYTDLGASVYVEPEKVKAFEEWFNGQILLRVETRTVQGYLRVQRIYLDTLRSELRELTKHIKNINLERTKRIRILQMKKDNKDIETAVDILDTLTSDKPESNNVVPFLSVITGGNDGPGKNWLIELPEGTIFMCKKNGPEEFIAHQFVIDWKGKRGVLLSSNIPVKMEVPVDSVGFSKTHELIEVQRKGVEDVD